CGSREKPIRCAGIPSRCSSTARRPMRRLHRHRRRSSSIAVVRRRKTMRRHHESPFGPELTADGVRFRLWAPRAHEVELLLENIGTDPLPMNPEPDGWFSLATGEAGPGSRYLYRVDGSVYPDPASRCQPDGVHGASEVIDPPAYRWGDGEWQGRAWHELVIYELHPGTFSDIGDFTRPVA